MIIIKKLLLTLFFIVNILLFFNIKAVYEYKDLMYIQDFFRDQDVVISLVELDNSSHDLDTLEMFEWFEYFTQEYEIIIKYNVIDYERQSYQFYFSAAGNIDELLKLESSRSINFNEEPHYFLTNQKTEDDNGIDFFLLNQKLDVQIYPMTAMGDIAYGGFYFFISESQTELEEAMTIFQEAFGNHIQGIHTIGSDSFDTSEEIQVFLSPLIAITLGCTFLILMMYVYDNSKKIAIFKTQGLSLIVIVKKLFLPIFFWSLLVISVVNLVLFISSVGVINGRTIPFIYSLIQGGIYQVFGILGVIGLSCFLLTSIPTYSLLKNNQLNRYLMNLNFIMKIIVIVVFLPVTGSRIIETMEHLSVIDYMNHFEPVKDYHYITAPKAAYLVDGYDLSHYASEYYETLKQDIIYEYDILWQYHNAYQVLNEAGAIFTNFSVTNFGFADFSETPSEGVVLYVNENFIRKHSIKDLEGNPIKWENYDGDVIYLVPEILWNQYGEAGIPKEWNQPNYDIIIIHNEQTFIDYSFSRNLIKTDSPFFITLYTDSAFRIDASPFLNMYLDDDINDLLKETIFYNRIRVETIGENLEWMRNHRMNLITDELVIVIPMITFLLIIIIQYAYLYLNVYQKQIYVKKLLGHNPFTILIRLLIESNIAVITAIIIAINNDVNYEILWVVIGLDCLVYLSSVLWSQLNYSLVHGYK